MQLATIRFPYVMPCINSCLLCIHNHSPSASSLRKTETMTIAHFCDMKKLLCSVVVYMWVPIRPYTALFDTSLASLATNHLMVLIKREFLGYNDGQCVAVWCRLVSISFTHHFFYVSKLM